jgi:hypothetical protein
VSEIGTALLISGIIVFLGLGGMSLGAAIGGAKLAKQKIKEGEWD